MAMQQKGTERVAILPQLVVSQVAYSKQLCNTSEARTEGSSPDKDRQGPASSRTEGGSLGKDRQGPTGVTPRSFSSSSSQILSQRGPAPNSDSCMTTQDGLATTPYLNPGSYEGLHHMLLWMALDKSPGDAIGWSQ